jgi:hypothetical protein
LKVQEWEVQGFGRPVALRGRNIDETSFREARLGFEPRTLRI